MADRIQLRRGDTSAWNSANPVLEDGEVGLNTTLGQFKIGDGITQWSNLDYYPSASSLDTSLDGYISINERAVADGVATLDGSGNVPISQLGNIINGAPGTLDTLQEIATAINNDPDFFNNLDALPIQTGNAGKYLTTNGTTASWAEASAPTPHPFAMMG